MNALESLLFEGKKEYNAETKYKHGAYLMLRHNTEDFTSILDEFDKVYELAYLQVKGTKLNSNRSKTSPRVPLPKHIKNSVKQKQPLMVSTIELHKSGNKEVFVSHHFIYGTHWSLTSGTEKRFEEDLQVLLTNRLETVSADARCFLLQPVGLEDGQELDRVDDTTIDAYIRFMDIEVTFDGEEEEEDDRDTLLNFFNKLMKPQIKYGLIYSHIG